MEITSTHDYAIALALGTFCYNKERSYIICESGRNIDDIAGRSVFVGHFTAHIYRRGKFKFVCEIEYIDGKQYYSVDKIKI